MGTPWGDNEIRDQFRHKVGLAEMLKGGVIMDVTNAEQAKIAEEAGAVAVMALERIPSDIRKMGGIARMSQPQMIREIQETVSIPVMAKVRIGHFAEAQILQALGVDFIDESEVLTPADNQNHIYKHDFKVPFVCGCRNLGEALRRIGEGAAMMRTKGEAGSGDIVEAVTHMREVQEGIRRLQSMRTDEMMAEAKRLGAPYHVLVETAELGKQLGAETVFVGSGIFASDDPAPRARAIVQAVTFHDDPAKLMEVSMTLGEAMKGRAVNEMDEGEKMAGRGW
jgi:pyridoxal 5'-phosphate synthase pdxS subunit